MNLTVLSKILKRKEENRLFHIVLPYDIMGKIMDKAMKEKIKKYKIKHKATLYSYCLILRGTYVHRIKT
jgi:arginine/lysine/ornithine decarboxylase